MFGDGLKVADELVEEHRREMEQEGAAVDKSEAKNIRRRVYDAINVLMALNIIAKEKKQIKWIGLPTNSAQEYRAYESMRAKKEQQVATTKKKVRDLILQVRLLSRSPF